MINTRTLLVWVAPNDVSGGAGAARARVGVLAFDFRSGGGEPLSHARVVCVLDAERRPRGPCDKDQVPRTAGAITAPDAMQSALLIAPFLPLKEYAN